MKLTVAQLEDLQLAAQSISERLKDEIQVQYRLEGEYPVHEWGASERQVEIEEEYDAILTALQKIETMTQIMGNDRYKELEPQAKAEYLENVEARGGVVECPPTPEPDWREEQNDLIYELLQLGIDLIGEEDEPEV